MFCPYLHSSPPYLLKAGSREWGQKPLVRVSFLCGDLSSRQWYTSDGVSPQARARKGQVPPQTQEASNLVILLLPSYPRAPGSAAHCAAISPSWTEEGCLHSPPQFHSACSQTDDNRDGAYGPKVTQHSVEVTLFLWALGEGPILLSTAYVFVLQKGTRSPLPSLEKNMCRNS